MIIFSIIFEKKLQNAFGTKTIILVNDHFSVHILYASMEKRPKLLEFPKNVRIEFIDHFEAPWWLGSGPKAIKQRNANK